MARIALLDPDLTFRHLLSKHLESAGHEVLFSCGNTEETLLHLRQSEQSVDLIITEIATAPMNGYEFAKYLHDHWSAIKVLVISRCNTSYSVVHMLQNRISGYITRSTPLEEVDDCVKQILAGETYYSKNVLASMLDALVVRPYIWPNTFKPEELEFIKRCCSEDPYKVIAADMNTTMRVIDMHRIAVFTKLSLSSREGVILFALRNGIVPF